MLFPHCAAAAPTRTTMPFLAAAGIAFAGPRRSPGSARAHTSRIWRRRPITHSTEPAVNAPTPANGGHASLPVFGNGEPGAIVVGVVPSVDTVPGAVVVVEAVAVDDVVVDADVVEVAGAVVPSVTIVVDGGSVVLVDDDAVLDVVCNVVLDAIVEVVVLVLDVDALVEVVVVLVDASGTEVDVLDVLDVLDVDDDVDDASGGGHGLMTTFMSLWMTSPQNVPNRLEWFPSPKLALGAYTWP